MENPRSITRAYISAFDVNGNLYNYWTVALLSIDTVPLALACAGLPVNICAEEGRYEFDAVLTADCRRLHTRLPALLSQRHYWKPGYPVGSGMSVTATIPDPALAANNNSPVFNNYPPTAFCVSFPINFDHSATDADGDSLVYEICSGLTDQI
jgi:hypothetical protein